MRLFGLFRRTLLAKLYSTVQWSVARFIGPRFNAKLNPTVLNKYVIFSHHDATIE